MRTYPCQECGDQYDSEWKATYCAKQDLDPRKENERLRTGSQREIVRGLFVDRQRYTIEGDAPTPPPVR